MMESPDNTGISTPWWAQHWVLSTLTLVSVVGLAGVTPLFDVDEGAFTEATREMLASGNWISTYLNGEPRHDKPILIYWLQAISASAFGLTEWALRLPSMMASCVWTFLVWRFTRTQFHTEEPNRVAALTVWVLVAGWLTPIIFKAAIADALLNTLLVWALFSGYRWLQMPSNLRLFWFSLALGLAFLTKGPIALVIPGGTLLITMALSRQLPLLLAGLLNPLGWSTFLLVVLPWHVASYLDQGTAFFEGFYLGHNLGRFSETMESHGGSPVYYIFLLPIIVLPWVAWLPKLFVSMLTRLRPIRAVDDDHRLRVYLQVWFLVTFVLFSFSGTQLPHYLLYGLTPLFILLAERVATDKAPIRWRVLPGMVGAIIFALFPVVIPYLEVKDGYLSATLLLGFGVFQQWQPWVIATLCIVTLAIWSLLRFAAGVTALLIAAFSLMAAVNFVALPIVAAAQQEPAKQVGLRVAQLPADASVISRHIRMPSVSVYAQRVIPDREPQAGDYVVTRINKILKIEEHTPQLIFTSLFQQGGVALLRAEHTDDTHLQLKP